MFKQFTLITLLAALLAACAARGPMLTEAEREAVWEQHQATLLAVDAWELRGKLGIRTPEKGWNLSMNWEQQQDTYEIQAIAPLGQGSAHITGHPGYVGLRTSDGVTTRAADPETLLAERMGWSLPISQLHYWIRGIPAPDTHYLGELNEQGLLSELEQHGWQIQYERYGSFDGLSLPTRLELAQNELNLRIIIRQWDL